MLLPSNGKYRDNDDSNERPKGARNGVEVRAEKLHRQAGGVQVGNVVAQHGEGEHDQAELGPADRMVGFEQQTAQLVFFVRCSIGWVCSCDGGVAEAVTNCCRERRGDHDAPECQPENLPERRIGGVVAVVVCGDRAPARSIG